MFIFYIYILLVSQPRSLQSHPGCGSPCHVPNPSGANFASNCFQPLERHGNQTSGCTTQQKNGYNQHMPPHMLQIAIKTHTSIYPNTINTLHALYPKVIPSPSTKRFYCHTQMFNCFLLFHSRSFKGRPGCRSPGHVPSPSREGSI